MPVNYKLGHIKARAFYGYPSENEALLNAAVWAFVNDAAVIAIDMTYVSDDDEPGGRHGVHLIYEV